MIRSLVFIPILALGFTAPASAQQKSELAKEGKYDATGCYSGTANAIDFSKTHTAASFESIGSNRSNPAGGFLDMTSFRCVGSFLIIEGKVSGTSICESVDKDGDKMLTKFTIDGPKSTVDSAVGTGKYEGITRTGGTESLGVFPVAKPGTFQGCNHATGTYKLK